MNPGQSTPRGVGGGGLVLTFCIISAGSKVEGGDGVRGCCRGTCLEMLIGPNILDGAFLGDVLLPSVAAAGTVVTVDFL